MRTLRDYRCGACGAVTEHLVSGNAPGTRSCVECGATAFLQLSAPRSRLEGISGSFPTAYDRWARVHVEAAKVGAKRTEGKYDQPEVL